VINLTKAQHNMLCELIRDSEGDFSSSVELHPEDKRVAKALAEKGVLELDLDGRSSTEFFECTFTERFVELVGYNIVHLYLERFLGNRNDESLVDAWLRNCIIMSSESVLGGTIRDSVSAVIIRSFGSMVDEASIIEKPNKYAAIIEPGDDEGDEW